MAGGAGVRHMIEIFCGEIDRVMGLMGASRIAELGPDCLLRRGA